MVQTNDMLSVDDVINTLHCDLLGVVPDDTYIITSTNKGVPAVNEEKSLAGKAYLNIARRIQGEEVPFIDLDEPKCVLDKIKRFFKSLKKGE